MQPRKLPEEPVRLVIQSSVQELTKGYRPCRETERQGLTQSRLAQSIRAHFFRGTHFCMELVQAGYDPHPLSRLEGIEADGAVLRLDDAVGRRLRNQEGRVPPDLPLARPDRRRHFVVVVEVKQRLVVLSHGETSKEGGGEGGVLMSCTLDH